MVRTTAGQSSKVPRHARGVAAVLAVGLLLTSAPGALAAAPVHSQDTLQWPDEVIAECDGFAVLSTSNDLYRNLVTWYDENGEIVQQRRRVHYDFTFTNTTTGTTAEYVGHFLVVQDNEAATLSLIGADSQLWIGGTPVLRVAGKTTFSEDGVSTHGLSSRDEFAARLCEAMA